MAGELKIGNHHIHDDSDCYVIAEIGHNHQGSFETAKEMIHVAKECGVSAVKFQKRDNRSLYTESFYNKPYENEFSYGPTYGSHREKLELSKEIYKDLLHYSEELEIDFIATAFDFISADFLNSIGVTAFKSASGDAKSLPLLEHIASFGKPLIVSTGGCNIDDVHRIYDAIMPINNHLAILQCTASYPSAHEHLDLNVIATYKKLFPDIVIGLSDHTNGIAMGPVAYQLGARVIEKHFTLNRALRGTDHGYSLEPVGFKKLVRDLKRTRVALGSSQKRVHECEKNPIIKMGKKLVAAKNLPVGHIITRDDIAIKSPGDGLQPYEINKVIGKRVKHELTMDDDILFEVLEED
ncbi:N-acetylneuraminate synthase [hydrothermal vent metagenome]|uniref:N-acetylneuraminate synthase n=1 Tax=hydrothermal vent metagenome TaxID=652676 RepID=A0A3B1CWW9_9ZZZZ